METTIFVAKIIAVTYTVIGLGFLLNAKYFRDAYEDLIDNRGCMILGGMMALVLGFVLVTMHNTWVWHWSVIVTIFGWIALVKGILIFLVPKLFIKFAKVFIGGMQLIGVGALIFGLVMGYLSYIY